MRGVEAVVFSAADVVPRSGDAIVAAGDVEKVEAMINMLQPLGIKELIRTGRIAIARETTHTASPRREPALLK